jgi:hypothetical protein
MTQPNRLTIHESANAALDVAYRKTAAPMLAQIDGLTRNRGSELQVALKRLDEEADRLAADGKRMTADNAVLQQTLRVVDATFKTTASLIKANDNKIETSGQIIAVPAVTAKVFLKLSGQAVAAGVDPVSDRAMAFYRREIAKAGAKWKEL